MPIIQIEIELFASLNVCFEAMTYFTHAYLLYYSIVSRENVDVQFTSVNLVRCVEEKGVDGNPAVAACCVWSCIYYCVTLFCCQLYNTCEKWGCSRGSLKQKGDNKWVKSFKPKPPPLSSKQCSVILYMYILFINHPRFVVYPNSSLIIFHHLMTWLVRYICTSITVDY